MGHTRNQSRFFSPRSFGAVQNFVCAFFLFCFGATSAQARLGTSFVAASGVLLLDRFLCVANKAALVHSVGLEKGAARLVHKLAQSNELLNKTKPKTHLRIFSGASPKSNTISSTRITRTTRSTGMNLQNLRNPQPGQTQTFEV